MGKTRRHIRTDPITLSIHTLLVLEADVLDHKLLAHEHLAAQLVAPPATHPRSASFLQLHLVPKGMHAACMSHFGMQCCHEHNAVAREL